jgi:hypothetical protein
MRMVSFLLLASLALTSANAYPTFALAITKLSVMIVLIRISNPRILSNGGCKKPPGGIGYATGRFLHFAE